MLRTPTIVHPHFARTHCDLTLRLPLKAVKVQIIQTLSMLINNIQNDTAVWPVAVDA